MRRRALFALGLAFAAAASAARAGAMTYADLPGWADDDHEAAFAVFRASCAHILAQAPDIRLAVPPSAALRQACREALDIGPGAARAFFERRFTPRRIDPPGFMTGYYEPEFAGSRMRTERFATPLRARPDDLVALPAEGGPPSPALAGLAAARRTASGTLEPYPDRAAIEDGALQGRGLELAWVADPFEAFLVQVQGSGRLRYDDGTVDRFAYAGRNGHAYTSVGRVLIDRGLLTREQVDLPAIRAVFAADPTLARAVMRQNRSYVFFRRLEGHDPALGPIGAQGVPLTPHRSIAVDRTVHAYGSPIFVVGTHPGASGPSTVRRLMIAQDTGSAIVGPARIDWFAGSGPEAERLAGALRHPATLYALDPTAP